LASRPPRFLVANHKFGEGLASKAPDHGAGPTRSRFVRPIAKYPSGRPTGGRYQWPTLGTVATRRERHEVCTQGHCPESSSGIFVGQGERGGVAFKGQTVTTPRLRCSLLVPPSSRIWRRTAPRSMLHRVLLSPAREIAARPTTARRIAPAVHGESFDTRRGTTRRVFNRPRRGLRPVDVFGTLSTLGKFGVDSGVLNQRPDAGRSVRLYSCPGSMPAVAKRGTRQSQGKPIGVERETGYESTGHSSVALHQSAPLGRCGRFRGGLV
jgi:hypothetical protein